jgi:acetate kinase
MQILAFNCGSSTVKFQLFESGPERIAERSDRALARGLVERIGEPESSVRFEIPGGERRERRVALRNHADAIEAALACLTADGAGLVKDLAEIAGVGHRIVHGGEYYADSVILDEEVARRIEECAALAPLHNPHNLSGYRAVRARLPHCPHVAVFDTAFHQTLPPHAYLYALPYEFYTRHKIRRYGFHGTSHRYVSLRFAELCGGRAEQFRVITCHLGSGCSVAAIDGGRSVDCSLGFTPLEGLVMGTRAGDLDPGVVLHLMTALGMTAQQVGALLNHRSGLLGLSGFTNDMRALLEAARGGDARARLAIEVFCYRVRKYLGAYHAVLNGADAVIFTGGIGENAPEVRLAVCQSLEALGIAVDRERNQRAIGVEAVISPPGARTEVWVIPTNEELLIARETVRCISGGSGLV